MSTRGWRGQAPKDEAEARARILAVTSSHVQRWGIAKTTLAEVAAEVGVTRQTVYRYFPSTAELLTAVAEVGAEDFLDRMAVRVRGIAEPFDLLVEAVLVAVEELPGDPRLGALLQIGDPDSFGKVVADRATEYGARFLERIDVDWSSTGYDAVRIKLITELGIRLFLSLVQFPSQPPRSTEELRGALRAWLSLARPAHAEPART